MTPEEQKQHFSYQNQESASYEILSDYYEEEDNSSCMEFYQSYVILMATGSGKTIVLIKIIELFPGFI